MKTFKTFTSMLLVLVLLLGMLPMQVMAQETCTHESVKETIVSNGNGSHTTVSMCDDCGEKILPETGTETAVVRVDFKKFAKDAAEQDWWQGLRPAVDENTKFVGNTDSSNTMSPYVTSYDAMLAYLDAHENWTIDESISNLKGGFKRLYWNSDDKVPWGLTYYTYYQGGAQAARSRLAFTVEAEKEGWYDLSIDLFKEWSSYTERREITGDLPGGGAVEIRVNDVLVCEKMSFADRSDSRMVENIGKVWLNEGGNSVVFTALHSYSGVGDVTGGRFNVALNAFVFVMAPQPQMQPGSELAVDPAAYVTFGDTNITAQTHAVTSSDETVASAYLNETNKLVITAGANGIAQISIAKGGTEVCRLTVTVGDGVTEPCVDEEENGICDICEGVCGECRHKSTETVVADNGDGTKTTTETCNYCGVVVRNFTRSEKEIVLDFKDFAKDISKFDWWDDLAPAADAQTRMIGSASPDAEMTAVQRAAYDAMLEHLEQNYQWNIDEDITGLTRKAYWKRLFINNDEDVPWGFCYFPIYHSRLPERARLAFSVEVPAGKDGFYHIDLSVFKEDTNAGTEAQTGTYSGGGYVDIYVNGELVYDEYSFKDANLSVTDSLGAVYLHEGLNSLIFESTSSYSFDDYTGRCNLDFQSVRFLRLDPIEVQAYLTASVDLKKTYLAFDADTVGLTAEVENDLIASVDITSAGMVHITGVSVGETEIRVMRGTEVLCVIPVEVMAFDGPLDSLGGSAVRLELASVVGKASQLPMWDALTETENGKQITMDDSALLLWIEANTNWGIGGMEGALYADRSFGLCPDGMIMLDADMPAQGLYNVTLEYAAGAGSLSLAVNGEMVCETLPATGGTTVKRSIGTAYFEKGANVLQLTAEGMSLRAVILTPLGLWDTEVDRSRYVDLNETYLPYDVEVGADTFTAVSADAAVAKAQIDADGMLVVTGVSEGETSVTVSGPDGFRAVLQVKVFAWSAFSEAVYTIDGFKAETLEAGTVAEGVLTGLTAGGAPLTEAQLRKAGSVYFATSDKDVAVVDQASGDVTCRAEGKAVITAYVLLEGELRQTSVTVSVTDDTDLAAITLEAPVDFVAVGNAIRLSAQGVKASGRAADMSGFPVVYTMEETDCAVLTEDGCLTGVKPGEITITATVGVQGASVTDTMTIRVVASTELPHEDIKYDLTLGRVLKLKDGSVERDGIALDRANSYLEGSSLTYNAKSGLLSGVSMPVGEQLAFDLLIPVDGWYTAEVWSALESYGGVADVFIDDIYAGVADFDQGGNTTYSGHSCMNTVYLTAGVHSYRLVSAKTGQWFIGKIVFTAADDPRPMEIALSVPETVLVGQTVEAEQTVKTADGHGDLRLKQVDSVPSYTNYSILTSSAPSVVAVSGSSLEAKKAGTAKITMQAEVNGETVTRTETVTVCEGSVAAVSAGAETASLKPDAQGTKILVTLTGIDGAALETAPEGVTVSYESLHPDIADVDDDGTVTITGREGSAQILVTVEEKGRQLTCSAWVTVTAGKTAPTLFTYAERANAQENVLKYDWAWKQKTAAVREADFVLEHFDQFYDALIFSDLPHIYHVGTRTDPEMYFCRYCKEDLSKKYSVYPWIVDPINNPWKITCPSCKRDFPSNDFGAYFESGLQENGRFDPEKADKSLLVNDLYPEMGPGWGVDDGFGYLTGNVYPNGAKENHYYIAYYVHCVFYSLGNGAKYGLTRYMPSLIDAYLYTGDEKYGNAGAILIDRMADVYGEYDYTDWIGDWDKGLITHAVWEANTLQPILAKAADAFWPCMTNDEVVEYARSKAACKGLAPDEITPDQIRANVEDGILLVIKKTCENGQSYGNFGMHQSAMAYAAVALDRLPETEEMIDWIFRDGGLEEVDGETVITGGDLMDSLVNRVDRDGFGDEGSDAYNRLWYQNLMEVADALSGYTGVEGADLWKNPKFVSMFGCYTDLIVMGRASMISGEDGAIQDMGIMTQPEYLLQVFQATGNRDVARNLYFVNGNTTDGLHGDIFMKDPESGIRSAIQKIVDEEGPYVWNYSNMLCGHGMAILRNGPQTLIRGKNEMEFSDYWMFFGVNGNTHGTLESLTLSVDAFGLVMTPNMGYPTVVNEQNPQRMQWIKHTISHNTVVVDDEIQSSFSPNAFPLHFDDSGMVKVMDAESPNAYPKTDIYRRTVISVQAEENVYYAVDLFRILGGREHVYSFHAATMIDPVTTGLSLDHQAMGTYAGPDIPYGDHTTNPYSNDAALNTGSGYSWLDDVYRDAEPETTFTVDWQIQDFRHNLTDASGVHLKMHMLSEEPVSEVALANGHPPTRAENPEHVEFLLVRRSGEKGMDSLFTTVIEPYRYDPYIAATELVEVELLEGTETVTDRVAAVKVTLNDGREDYIVYATNTDCTYRVADLFDFSGAIGVCSYRDGKQVYAYGNEATVVSEMIEDARPAVTGTVADFTEGLAETYTMTVKLDGSTAAENLTGRFIYVDNDRKQNGVYRIYGAEVEGDTAVLDLHTQTLTRSYVDARDLDSGFIHNISVGDSFTIPLPSTFNVSELFTYTTDQVVKAGNKQILTLGKAGSGAAYEVEGLPTSAKVDAKTGTVTWTPSRTQTGRYLVTVKAIQDGEVMGEMDFVIYVVSYTGSTYEASKCNHAKAVSYTVGGMIETVCPACGTVSKTEASISKFAFVGSNMTLGNELKLNFMVDTADLKDGYKALITHKGETVEAKFNKYNNTYSFVSCSVAAKEMADAIEVVVVDTDGKEVSEVYTASVRDYAMKALAAATSTAKVKTMVVDMLNYGAAAQTYFEYNEADLANKLLTDAQKAWATPEVACTDKRVKGENYYGSNLSLEDKILLNLYFKNCTESMTAEVSYIDYSGKTVTAEAVLEQYSGNIYKVVVDEIVLADAFCDVTVTVYDGETVHGTATDSVESYVARADRSDLYESIMKFATSAKAYFS